MKLSSIVWVFILVALVIAIHVSLFMVVLNNGFTTEEWLLLFDYKIIGPNLDFIDKIFIIFQYRGIYFTTYILYIGMLENLFKDNYVAYQVTSIFFKILATLSVYPLIYILFKRRSLAFLTTVLYSMSFSSAGALQFAVKGIDYLAIFFMNIFLISYYYSLTTKKGFIFLTTSILLFLCFISSPIRVYPLIIFIIIFEAVIWIKRKGLVGLITASSRLLFLLYPFLIILLFMMFTFPEFTSNYSNGPVTLFKFIKDGNYQLLLSPFAGFGYTFLGNDYWSIFGKLKLDRFQSYLSFLVHGPLIIYSILAILLGYLITKKPFPFIIKIIFFNVIFEIFTYFLITHVRNQTGPDIKEFYSISTYAIFLGFFVISIAVSSLLLWLKDKKANSLLKPLFIGPFFAGLFLWGTWFIIGTNLTFKEGIHWYLIIPPIGTSLFLAGLIELGLYKIKKLNVDSYTKKLLVLNVSLVIITIYLISSKEINLTFGSLINLGYKATDQKNITSELINNINKSAFRDPIFFYLEIDKDQEASDTFYMNALSLVVGFEEKMLLRNFELNKSCIALLHERYKLETAITFKDGIKGFAIKSICVNDDYSVGRPIVFYRPKEFYAFRLRNRHLINFKEELLNELGFLK